MKVGDRVRLKPAFCSEGELDIVYVVRNINEVTNRAYIECQEINSIRPQELVGINMITKIKEEVER